MHGNNEKKVYISDKDSSESEESESESEHSLIHSFIHRSESPGIYLGVSYLISIDC